jgi:hypothetical protein
METTVSSTDKWARDFLNGPSRRGRGRRGGAYTSPEARAQEIAEAAAEREGARFPTGDTSHITINATSDPKAPDGYYVSVGDDTDHSTAVYNGDGTLADVKANRDWETRPRQ